MAKRKWLWVTRDEGDMCLLVWPGKPREAGVSPMLELHANGWELVFGEAPPDECEMLVTFAATTGNGEIKRLHKEGEELHEELLSLQLGGWKCS